MITEQEAERRIRRVAEMRNLLLELRRSAWEERRKGRFPTEPAYDIRSDVEYWTRLRDEKRRAQESGRNSQSG